MPYHDKAKHAAYMQKWKAKKAAAAATAKPAATLKRPAKWAASSPTQPSADAERKRRWLGWQEVPRAGWLIRADWKPKCQEGRPPSRAPCGTAPNPEDTAQKLASPTAQSFRTWWAETHKREVSLTTVQSTPGHPNAVALVKRSKGASSCLAALLAYWWLLDWGVAVEVGQLLLSPEPQWRQVLQCLNQDAPCRDTPGGESPRGRRRKRDPATPLPLRHRPGRRGVYASPAATAGPRRQILQELETLRTWHWHLNKRGPWCDLTMADLKREHTSVDVAARLSTLPAVGVYLAKCVVGTLTVAQAVHFTGGCIGPFAEAVLRDFTSEAARPRLTGVWPWQRSDLHVLVAELAEEFEVHWIDVQQALCSFKRDQRRPASAGGSPGQSRASLAPHLPPEPLGEACSGDAAQTQKPTVATAAPPAAEPAAESAALTAAAEPTAAAPPAAAGRQAVWGLGGAVVRRLRGKQKQPEACRPSSRGRASKTPSLGRGRCLLGKRRSRQRFIAAATPAPEPPRLRFSTPTPAATVEAARASLGPPPPQCAPAAGHGGEPRTPPRKRPKSGAAGVAGDADVARDAFTGTKLFRHIFSGLPLRAATTELHRVAGEVWPQIAEGLGEGAACRWRACLEGYWAQIVGALPATETVTPDHLAAVAQLAMKWVSAEAASHDVWVGAADEVARRLQAAEDAADRKPAECQVLKWVDYRAPAAALA